MLFIFGNRTGNAVVTENWRLGGKIKPDREPFGNGVPLRPPQTAPFIESIFIIKCLKTEARVINRRTRWDEMVSDELLVTQTDAARRCLSFLKNAIHSGLLTVVEE